MPEQVSDLEKSNEIWRKNRQIARRIDTETLIALAVAFGSSESEKEFAYNRMARN